jgi:hypothetical protein
MTWNIRRTLEAKSNPHKGKWCLSDQEMSQRDQSPKRKSLEPCLKKIEDLKLASRPKHGIEESAKLFCRLAARALNLRSEQISRKASHELSTALFDLGTDVIEVGQFRFWCNDKAIHVGDDNPGFPTQSLNFAESINCWLAKRQSKQ